MNIGFFGGTFSPPHKGHLHSAKMFLKECELDKLIIIPAKVSPFKTASQKTAEDFHRLNMTKLCFEGLCDEKFDFEVSDYEIAKDETSYTYLTVKHLLSQYPCCHLFMYVGCDMFLTLEKWKNYREIFKECSIYTHSRNKNELNLMNEQKNRYEKLYDARIIISQDKPLCVSSTEIRNLLSQNNTETLKNLLTDEVFRYIMENRLYFGE